MQIKPSTCCSLILLKCYISKWTRYETIKLMYLFFLNFSHISEQKFEFCKSYNWNVYKSYKVNWTFAGLAVGKVAKSKNSKSKWQICMSPLYNCKLESDLYWNSITLASLNLNIFLHHYRSYSISHADSTIISPKNWSMCLPSFPWSQLWPSQLLRRCISSSCFLRDGKTQ